MATKTAFDFPTDKPIVLFDGVCNLCNGFVQQMIKLDPQGQFRYAAIQSPTGQQIMESQGLSTSNITTVVLYDQGEVYTYSDVALEIARRLGFPWNLTYGFIILPKGFRNIVYNWIARNRYRWFGQKETCMIPTPELKSRFL